jgi:superfamily II DNA or RNA helicase
MEAQLHGLNLEPMVAAEAAHCATSDELQALKADPVTWAAVLRRLIRETDESVDTARRLTGEERDQVLFDLTAERDRLADALGRLTGERPTFGSDEAVVDDEAVDDQADDVERVPGRPRPRAADDPFRLSPLSAPVLQASWAGGQVVLWGGGPGVDPADEEQLEELIREACASAIDWEPGPSVHLPGQRPAAGRSAPLGRALGWLVGVGAGQLGENTGASLRWLGKVAVWGTELVAQGRMTPTLRRSSQPGGRRGGSRYRVRWVPALIERRRMHDLVSSMPGSVAVMEHGARPEGICRGVLFAVVDAVCRAGAERLVVPATVPHARNRSEVAEALLSGLDGKPFSAEPDLAGHVSEELRRWTSPVTVDNAPGLVIRLDPPESNGGWLLTVEATGVDRQPLQIERALAVATGARAQQVESQIRRLERLLPALKRPSDRRGLVMLSGEEAAEFMFETGPTLSAAGFEVRIPAVSRRAPGPRLRLFAEAERGPSQVGAQQLARVRWSVLFDDLELDAAEIARLSAEAKPLVRVRGRWVSLDRGDLAAAAAALAEHSKIGELSGAAIVRQAVGLGGGPLAGPVSVEGSGWAVDLIKGATTNPPEPCQAPPGFAGRLRSYQAEAAGWLGFLDRGGLGGCLAMDMGLGKTPTVLAHLLATRGQGPVLVVCPPAVLGNWAAEAERFTPELRVRVHHGPGRVEPGEFAGLATGADVVLTTYATAVRDVEAVAKVDWTRMIVDEAQAIKNSHSETARALRTIPARSRLALTGTPIENGLGDLWSILDFTNPGLVGARGPFIEHLSRTDGESSVEEGALRALNGLLIFRRTKSEPQIAAELSDKIDQLEQCGMTAEQVGLYQAVLDRLLAEGLDEDRSSRKGNVLAAITALKQICNHPSGYVEDDDQPLHGRSGKLSRLEELVEQVFAAGERMLIFTHFARWGEKLADYLSERTGRRIECYHGGLSRTARDRMIHGFQSGTGAGALVLSLKAGGSGLNLTAASHVVLYDRWWNPAVEDQARDRAWRIGQTKGVICHRLVCPGTVDERVEEVVAGKRRIADLVLPAQSSLADVSREQLRAALGFTDDLLIEEEPIDDESDEDQEAA